MLERRDAEVRGQVVVAVERAKSTVLSASDAQHARDVVKAARRLGPPR